LSAPRLLILADPKMLAALAGGLREGGRFDVTGVSFADPAAAQAAAGQADALALFYGAPGTPISAALQALSPKVRERGGRVMAVLQREQIAQRDECFRAGASDLLFMPTPKDQFVARLSASVALAFSSDAGAPAHVAVATRGSSSRLDRATVSPSGVESPGQLPLKPGETVRLAWAGLQFWGLVVRGTPSTQIRFAGLTPDEEAKIREWVKGAGQPDVPPLQRPPIQAPPRPAGVAPPPTTRAVTAQPPAAPAAAPAAQPPAAQPNARAAPVAGPPPGFADRQSPRAAPRPPARPVRIITPPEGSPAVPGPAAPAAARPPVPAAPQAAAAAAQKAAQAQPAAGPRPRQPAAASGLEGLFDGEGGGPAAAPPAPARPAAPSGPPWPAPVNAATCKSAALQLLIDDTVARGVPANIAASARKVTGMLSVGERAFIERTGAESHFADALAARIALDASTAEANRLTSAGSTPSVDADSLSALTKVADEAAARLQKEANAAIGKGEVENLQLITAASASLSRDLLNLKETADRLRGVGAAPRMGAGALDPDMVLPGEKPRPRPLPGTQASAPVRAELRDFRGLDHKPSRGKEILALIILVAAIGGAAHAFYFGVPRQQDMSVQSAGDGVQRITVTGSSAVVVVTADWVAARDARLPRLLQALRSNKELKKAVLMLPNGASAGIVDLIVQKPAAPSPPAAPPQSSAAK